MSLTLNGLDIKSASIWIPWRGAWVADIEMGIDDAALLPSGAVLLKIGDAVYQGTTDPRASGTFVSNATVRVVGGAGGWDKPVKPQHFHIAAGALTSTAVYTATAGLVGETVVDAEPVAYGTDFVRSGGAAMRVFGDRDWHVDPTTGVTHAGAWAASSLGTNDTIADFDIASQRVTIAAGSLVLPGTVLTDSRFNGASYVVRDVQATFTKDGGTTVVWCCERPVSRLTETLASMVREFAGTAYLRHYRYRFVLGSPNALALQAITVGAPDLNPVKQWSGLSGALATLTPGTEIIVGFVDPSTPYIAAFSSLATPLEIDLAGGADYVALATKVDAIFNSLQSIFNSWTPVPNDGGAALKTLLNAWATPSTAAALVKAT